MSQPTPTLPTARRSLTSCIEFTAKVIVTEPEINVLYRDSAVSVLCLLAIEMFQAVGDAIQLGGNHVDLGSHRGNRSLQDRGIASHSRNRLGIGVHPILRRRRRASSPGSASSVSVEGSGVHMVNEVVPVAPDQL